MPTYMSVKRTIKPKNKIPKFKLSKGVKYHITDLGNGKINIKKTVYKKWNVNKI